MNSVRSAQYSKTLRLLVMLGWIAMGILAVRESFKSADLMRTASAVGFIGALLLILHLEFFTVQISWDDVNIYTRSPWRRRRTIPFTAVTSCDYHSGMQWYRIHTNGYGIIRLHQFMSGVPELLAALPCPTPPYPPNVGYSAK